MNNQKKHFFVKLNPFRSSFTVDMNDEERNIMQQHIAYWSPFLNDGTLIVFGPVMDPKGGFGVAIVAVDNEEQLKQMVAGDPANAIGSYEMHPMQAVTKQF
jgi:uncharacterized protein YciI